MCRIVYNTWPHATAPGIKNEIPADKARAVRDALKAVDLDIERTGTVSAETVDKVRAVRRQLGE
jgi:hypothetical protein